jgi:flavin reductase (DIM6/NTAB) family NADH-FMN oxidoreductase RutF
MRHVLAGVPTGIVVVAAATEGGIVGLSANSFTSISLDPPLVSISFAHTSTTWPTLRGASRWGLSVLGEEQEHVLRELRHPAARRFDRLDVNVDAGAAFVDGALARLTVELDGEIEAGDHVLTLLRVVALDRDLRQHPLVFYGSRAHRLAH